ncbi:hypothetical protein LBMAG53_37020 [Planctomycetota bacterium]|nr:hypothetical protein LBMAG53_37020 [Planctomycetota bacterium]
MASQLEVELKLILDEPGHVRLAEVLAAEHGPGQVLEQRNRFFDTADRRLRRAGLNLRLRREALRDGHRERLVMTCKRAAAAAMGGIHRHDEWEAEIDPALWELPAAELPLRLPLPEPHTEALGQATTELIGGFANRRIEWHLPTALACLDRTVFSGPAGERIDHELEVESAEPDPASWRRRFAALGLAWREQPATKFARFLEHLQVRTRVK